ncbi:MAG TPA: tyrosine/phenylalanine carboxypeptidase domain-containing protein, partial [Thermoanaerobaculia bacterium]|nr:tyrosine/phenylalanine carboxypeptidase domain-containing protein [Thermoanaerobaculia bacterium]
MSVAGDGGRSSVPPAAERAAEVPAVTVAADAREVAEAVDADRPVSVPLAGEGLLYLDRRLPFVVVYRRPADREDLGAERLVTGESCYAVADLTAGAGASGEGEPGDEVDVAADGPVGGVAADPGAELAEVLGWTVSALARHFPHVLLLETWTRPEGLGPWPAAEEVEGAVVPGEAPPPAFRVFPGDAPATAAALGKALREIVLDDRAAWVTIEEGLAAPPGLEALAPLAGDLRPGVLCRLGVEVEPVFRHGAGGVLYPVRFVELRRSWHRALEEALFEFCTQRAELAVPHFLALGRREMPEALWRIDHTLAEVSETFDYLLQLTPVNFDDAWEEFSAAGCRKRPHLRYRPLTVDVDRLKRRLYDVPLHAIEDPTVTALFREKQEELDRQITMLLDRDTPRFFHGSMLVYGEVDDDLVAVAREVLDRHPPSSPGRRRSAGGRLDEAAFAALARSEVDRFRRVLPGIGDLVEIRDDMYAGLMVSRGRLLIGRGYSVSAQRAQALVHHEIGTHVLTDLNGRAQRLRQLYLGFAGYEALQEGLAVLAEYLCGGLTAGRLRTLAGRVVAVRAMVDGAGFAETHRLLTGGHGFSPESAFTMVFRVWRGGGFTKDKVYLEGLRDVLAHLEQGEEIEPLYVGKVAAAHLPVVRELELRGV